MSQWNNSYAYNNQYQGANTWNGDANGQYTNQGYYPNAGNQYVSFNEFLSQMQTNNMPAPNAASYNNTQYQNYPAQYNYQNMQASSQPAPVDPAPYTYGSSVASVANGEAYAQTQYDAVLPESNMFANEIVKKSNLTPTATEFVPKSSSVNIASSTQNVQLEPSSLYNNIKESKSIHGSSSDRNWRERPQTSKQNSTPRQNETFRSNESSSYNPKNYDSNNHNRDSNSKRNREYSNRNHEFNNRNYESSSRNNESNNRNTEFNNPNYEPDNQDYESNRYNYESSSQNYESGSRNYDSNNRNPELNTRSYDSNNRNPESNSRSQESNGRNQESNGRNQESNGRNYESNRYNDRGQSKSKSKNKDSERTFYNSSINKGQEPRSARGEGSGRKNWVGSQRLRAVDRNSVEDEQYANSYNLYQREEKERMAKSENVSSPRKNKNAAEPGHNKEMTQRERLTEQLSKGTLECLVCCERVKQTDSVWSCSNCYHVLHLRCIRKWATSSIVEGKWRCPACQNTSAEVPSEYRCLCGAVRQPEWQRGGNGGAHSCGKFCKRPRPCPHPCPLVCHPGPCPPCQAKLSKQCGCGAEAREVICSNKSPVVCTRMCQRKKECGVHGCDQPCHEGPCEPCDQIVKQVCSCKHPTEREVPCTSESAMETAWICGGPCLRVLACGAHTCSLPCHKLSCPPCPLLPETVTTCPCGKTRIDSSKRKKCTDLIPLCGNICAKPLACGPSGDKHFCKINCHEGVCPTCPDKTLLQCRCGHSSREVPCEELPEMLNNVFCQKKCNKKLSCGRHRCRTVCCAATSHRCAVICGRTLSCQLHRCEEFCHTGHCAPCPRVSFEELTCECGAEVMLPPIRCGARPPACSAECRRERPCGHPPHHTCHSGDCPPCVVLTTKMCHGRHEERKTIPCSQEEFSCGMPCGKPLPCGKHNCIKTCHKGPCDTAKCTQPCNEKRPSCGHPCAAPCHVGAGTGTESTCPSSAACRRLVRATCPCGRRHAERPCAENARDLAKIMSTLAATRMQEGGSVDLTDVMQRPNAMLKTLECDDECRVEARTRQLALALQIRNPDVSAKLAPRYSDHLRNTAAKEPSFAQQIHDKLTELVQLAKKSKQKTRSHSFPSMNWQKRQFIHELCEHFGCESVAYDAEPNRNVVATADKEKSWLPAMSVLEVLAREAGKRRVPGPILRAPAGVAFNAAPGSATSKSGWATLTSTNAWAARSQARQATHTSQTPAASAPSAPIQPPADKIDYFDNPPDN